MKYLREIQIAGLLHDIGKFYQKGTDNELVELKTKGKKHGEISGDFIDKYASIFRHYDLNVTALREFTQRHHESDYNDKNKAAAQKQMVQYADKEYKKYCKIISVADNMSSKERDINQLKEGFSYQTKPLASVFNRVGVDTEEVYNHKPSEYLKSGMIPSSSILKNEPSKVSAHINAFTKAMNVLADNMPDTFEDFVEELDGMLLKYCWSIPGSYQDMLADVSLYDHLKTTSAIATCMYMQLAAYSGDDFKESHANNATNMSMLKVTLVGAQEELCGKESISSLDELLGRQQVVEEAYHGINHVLTWKFKLCTTNIVIDTQNEKFVLVPTVLVEKVVGDFNKLSSTIAFKTDLRMFIEVRETKVNGESSFGAMHKVIAELNAQTNPILSLTHVLSNEAGWMTELPNLSKKRDTSQNVNKAISDFMKKHSDMSNIAIVRLDIDGFRKTMESGLSKENYDYTSISRIATLSRMVQAYLHTAIEQEYGEDSMFLVNNSDDILMLVDQDEAMSIVCGIQEQFSQFSINKIKMSAVVRQYTDRYSLRSIMHNIEVALTKLKKSGGNKLDYLGLNIKWEDTVEYMETVDEFADILRSGGSQIFIRLSEYSSMYRRYIETADASELMCIPYVQTDIKRNYKETVVPAEFQTRIKRAFKQSLVDRTQIDTFVFNLSSMVNDAMQLTKEDRTGGK